MNKRLRVGIYSSKDTREREFRRLLERCPETEVAGFASTRADLERLLAPGGVNAALIHLDDDVEFGLSIVQHVGRMTPDLGIVGISAATDPQTIIRAMRAGCAQYVCAPVDGQDLADALERIRHAHFGAARRSRRVCVLGSAGGAGATTVACNLALELARLSGARAGLIDLNLEFGDITCALDITPKYTIANLCEGSTIDRVMAESAMHELPSGVCILPGPKKLSEVARVTAAGIRQVLEAVGALYPNVVVDMPRSIHAETAAALEGADLVLIVTQLNVAGVRNATRLYEYLLELGAPEEVVELVINRCKADHGSVTLKDVEQHFRRPVFARIPNDYKQAISALDLGHPIAASAPSSPVRLAIQEMSQRIAVECCSPASDPKARRGLIGRLLARK